ncbi:MAG: acetylglucosamine-6-sulfatase [Lysobacteraceae bacterium]|nr:MAG: acetylglucosamine-6-sulfatase [Xanthomonadaceae bacterium]
MLAVFVPFIVAAQPNFVILFTDDQRFDAMGFRTPDLQTPNIDFLAGDGVVFDQAFATSPICPSSRISLLTGLYERMHGYTFDQPLVDSDLLNYSFAKRLRDAGYRSGFVGKNGANFDQPRIDQQFDSFTPIDQSLIGSHYTDRMADAAVSFIEQTPRSQPLVLNVWFWAPHADTRIPEQFVPPKRFDGLYDPIVFPRPATWGDDLFNGFPLFLQESLNREQFGLWWANDVYDVMSRRYFAMITGLDDAVGRIVSALQANGRGQDTWIILASDNGFFMGDRGFGGKWLGHDVSLRVPLIVHHADLLSRHHESYIATLLDIAPTIIELAGLPPNCLSHGNSLSPALLNPVLLHSDRTFYIEHTYNPAPNRAEIPAYDGVRSERWKYIVYTDHDFAELYDLANDPDETFNLIDSPDHSTVIEQLEQQRRHLAAALADKLFIASFEAS